MIQFNCKTRPALLRERGIKPAWAHSGLLSLAIGLSALNPASAADQSGLTDQTCNIISDGDQVRILAGNLTRTINIKDSDVYTASISVAGEQIMEGANELSFRIEKAFPNRCPVGVDAKSGGSITQKTSVSNSTDALEIKEEGGKVLDGGVKWQEPRDFSGKTWGKVFNLVNSQCSSPEPGTTQLMIRARALDDATLKGVSVNIFYQVYDGYPVVRKWVEIINNGSNWIKLSNLVIDDINLRDDYLNQTFLTPSEHGAVSSIIGFGNSAKTAGAIFASEVPSALRSIEDNGAMGYSNEHFEWVLGPSEKFESEPVFLYGYSGEVVKTISGTSLPLDRAVEKPFKKFLKKHIGVASTDGEIPAPLWCTWSNFGHNVTDEIIREQADIAARAGFAALQIDDGWQKGRLGVTPDIKRFPDLLATCEYVRSKGLKIGLWVSCFRLRDSDDLKALPEAATVPEIRRLDGVAMSFSSPWSTYFGNQLAYLHDYYGVTYFKQDFTNIKNGDFAKGHYSRSKKESLLRGLRGLFESQDVLRAQVPGIANQVTHEIYWGTPGVPCDLAVIKHATSYHVPPNDYSGVGHWKQRAGATAWWDKVDPKEQAEKLLEGCAKARNRFYLHRGLPLECIEFYGAATVNCKGSLTGEIQDRQICSWLLGAPTVYAGDLASLTEENIQRYHDRFEIIKRLEREYGIYRHFQYSGVPAPTDEDWHWWGKLNENGEGAVVVIRGNGGEEKRAINIPWVASEESYTVRTLFTEKELGTFKGLDLINGSLEVALPKYGQEILEVKIK
ncbi:alpha-galactosidase [Rubritalea marina]|uniref:alpha-galactosidase n=1 Tax=Rubritalea marina TaxID=361055 RepID=UPI00035CBD13|nr:alpha-galactosidase [Rubritalea marina]